MRRLFLLFSLAAFGLGLSQARAADPQQVLFYLDENRLIALEFQFSVDGNSVSEAWRNYLEARFEKIDANRDGEIAGQERDGLPNTRVMRIFNQSYTFRAPPEKMNLAEFQNYIEKKLEFQPFQVDIQSPQNQNVRQLTVFGQQTNPNQAAETLFAGLDGDADGRLSRKEMETAIEKLAKKDLDQNETISTSELVPTNYGQFVQSPSNPSPSNNSSTFLSLSSGTSRRDVALRLTNKYDTKDKDNALSRDELGVSEKIFAAHDIDGNGKWDFEEIQQYVRQPAVDVVVKVRLGSGSKSKQPRIEFEHDEELQSEVKSAIGSLNLKTVQMEISASGSSNRTPEDQLKAQFRSADQDNNGYIDKDEAGRVPNANMLFQELDKDNDEKLFLEELSDGILPLAELMQQQIRLSVTERGRDLFRILDTNADNRLSTREFWAMPDRAELWDKNGDGHITLSEIPQQYRLVASQGDFNLLNRLGGVVLSSPGAMPNPQGTANREGPIWFQRMDRNNDGDVSLREFLGTADDFKKLDKDEDGLIDPAEAAQADSK